MQFSSVFCFNYQLNITSHRLKSQIQPLTTKLPAFTPSKDPQHRLPASLPSSTCFLISCRGRREGGQGLFGASSVRGAGLIIMRRLAEDALSRAAQWRSCGQGLVREDGSQRKRDLQYR